MRCYGLQCASLHLGIALSHCLGGLYCSKIDLLCLSQQRNADDKVSCACSNTKPTNCALGADRGTSMAAPVVAGAVALLRQYFVQGFYPTGVAAAASGFTPSGPLLKAVLLGKLSSETCWYQCPLTGFHPAEGKFGQPCSGHDLV